MIATALIVFREIIEAGLIVGIVLAATRAVPRRGRWVVLGIAGGVIGACIVAAFAQTIAAQFSGAGSELFNAAILFVAVVMLTWHNVWMASHGREMTVALRDAGAAVVRGDRTLTALAIVVGVAVLREGSEVVLFLYGIAHQGGATAAGMLLGGGIGLAGGVALSAGLYFGLVAIPMHRLFGVTSGLITLLAAGMAAQAILFVQQGGYFEFLTETVWDTSSVLPQDSIAGRLLHTLAGYSDAPNGAQIVFYAATIAAIFILTAWQKSRR